jgi:hypothetical protein
MYTSQNDELRPYARAHPIAQTLPRERSRKAKKGMINASITRNIRAASNKLSLRGGGAR